MSVEIKLCTQISSLPKAKWNMFADCPLASHEFISALENSKSVGEGTGWEGAHLVAYEDQKITGVMPLWVKMHSYGEYIFDQAFADAYARSGLEYYPKLLAATPFTPVNGTRVFGDTDAIKSALIDASIGLAKINQISSVHINFATEVPPQNFITRHNIQYHFNNLSYENFDEFLSKLASSKRKNIRKERIIAKSSGLIFVTKTGHELNHTDWDCFWNCYQDTGARKWGSPYLTRAFFDEIAITMKDSIVMMLAYDGQKPIASALNFVSGERQIGRYWGTLVDVKCLHLELCYYMAIDYAIEHKIPLIEAGAQGEHKMGRGYAPVITKSYHHFLHQEFHKIIGKFISQESDDLAQYMNEANAHLPYRKETPNINLCE